LDAATAESNLKLQVFNLQHTLALSAFETVKELYPETVTSMDQRGNLLIARGTPSQIEEVSQLIEVLDVPPATGPFTAITQQLPAAGSDKRGTLLPPRAGDPRGWSMRLQESNRSVPSVDDNQVLRDTLASIIELGQQAGGTGESAPIPPELKAAIRTQVEAAFQARQQLQRSELQILNLQLERIKQSIGAREHVKEQIIDDRVDQLLTAAIGLPVPTIAQTGGANPEPTPTARPVSNPRVLSKHWNEAEKVLTAAGLRVKLRRGKVAATAEDIFKVYDQLPAAGTTMKVGDAVILTLFVSDTIPQPAIDSSGPTSLRELRTTIEQLQVELQAHQAAAERNPKRIDLDAVMARLRLTQRRLDVYRAELAAQESLAKLELEDAKSEVDHSVRSLDNAETRFKSGVAKEPEVLDAQRAVEKATFRLKRAETLLSLFQKVGRPKGATSFKPQPQKTPAADASSRSF
jgi:hypothetical protein